MSKIHLKNKDKAWCGSSDTDIRSKNEFILAIHDKKDICANCHAKVMEKHIVVDINLHKRIKVASINESLSMRDLLNKVMDYYEK